MSNNYESEILNGILIVRLLRKLSLKETFDFLDTIARQKDRSRRLYEVSGRFNYTMDEITEIAEHARSNWPTASRVAYVAKDDLSFGLCRMFEVFRIQDNYQARVFRNESEALAWLEQWEGEGAQPM